MIKQVKRYLTYINENPYTILHTDTVNTLLQKIEKHKVYSYLVTNNENELLGIVTKRDLNTHIIQNSDNSNLITSIMTDVSKMKLISTSDLFTMEDHINYMIKYRLEKLPIVEDKKIKGLIIFTNLMKYEMNKNKYSLDENNKLLVGAAIGIIDDYLERADALINAGCNILCIDVANGYNEKVAKIIKELKILYKDRNISIMAGNVCSADGFEFLCQAGADCIRVGIGNGSICSTRLVTGVGSGQFTALQQCRKMARKYNVGMISDGGHLGKDGNIAKALIIGSSAMMLGKTLAATDETPGRIINRNNKRVKYYRGMASAMAMVSKAELSKKEYNDTQNPEGVDMEIEIKGPVKNIIKRIESSIKSTMSYIGCKNISELRDIEEVIVYTRQSSGVMTETSIRGKII